jgi:hypothetical protein
VTANTEAASGASSSVRSNSIASSSTARPKAAPKKRGRVSVAKKKRVFCRYSRFTHSVDMVEGESSQ